MKSGQIVIAALIYASMTVVGPSYAGAQQTAEYWWLGQSPTQNSLLFYIDAASVAAVSGDVKHARTWIFVSEGMPAHLTGEYYVGFDEVNCRTRQWRMAEKTIYNRFGRTASWDVAIDPHPLGENGPEIWGDVVSGSVSESELRFICSDADAWASIGVPLSGGITPEQDAEQVMYAAQVSNGLHPFGMSSAITPNQ